MNSDNEVDNNCVKIDELLQTDDGLKLMMEFCDNDVRFVCSGNTRKNITTKSLDEFIDNYPNRDDYMKCLFLILNYIISSGIKGCKFSKKYYVDKYKFNPDMVAAIVDSLLLYRVILQTYSEGDDKYVYYFNHFKLSLFLKEHYSRYLNLYKNNTYKELFRQLESSLKDKRWSYIFKNSVVFESRNVVKVSNCITLKNIDERLYLFSDVVSDNLESSILSGFLNKFKGFGQYKKKSQYIYNKLLPVFYSIIYLNFTKDKHKHCNGCYYNGYMFDIDKLSVKLKCKQESLREYLNMLRDSNILQEIGCYINGRRIYRVSEEVYKYLGIDFEDPTKKNKKAEEKKSDPIPNNVSTQMTNLVKPANFHAVYSINKTKFKNWYSFKKYLIYCYKLNIVDNKPVDSDFLDLLCCLITDYINTKDAFYFDYVSLAKYSIKPYDVSLKTFVEYLEKVGIFVCVMESNNRTRYYMFSDFFKNQCINFTNKLDENRKAIIDITLPNSKITEETFSLEEDKNDSLKEKGEDKTVEQNMDMNTNKEELTEYQATLLKNINNMKANQLRILDLLISAFVNDNYKTSVEVTHDGKIEMNERGGCVMDIRSYNLTVTDSKDNVRCNVVYNVKD